MTAHPALRKLTKISRYWRARLRPAHMVPMFWHIGRPNFGDDFNPALFEALTGMPIRLIRDRSVPHFLGMGSIADKATEASTILGAGLITPAPPVARPRRIIALRGALSQNLLAAEAQVLLGDPMVLIDRLVRAAPEIAIGFVPHVSSVRLAARIAPPDMLVIDPGKAPWQVIRDIARCRRIISQSLHGLIVADALAIPNLWVAPSAKMTGGRFKFDDYFTTLDAAKTPHELTRDLLHSPPAGAFSVGHYRGDKAAYHARLTHALREGP